MSFGQIFNILEKYEIQANITTNGTLINKNIDVIKNTKVVRQINFSIHSIMQNENIDKQYLNNIFESERLLENIIISYRLWNLKNIKENDINIQIIKEIENYYGIQNLREQLMKNEFIKIKENVFINQDTEFTWPDINKKEVIQKGRCLGLKEQIAILVDGTVVPCCLDNNGDIPLGNIFNENLEDILNKPKTVKIKKNFENSIITCKLCKTCGFLKKLENKRKNNKNING